MAVISFRVDDETISRFEKLRRPGETRSDVLRRATEALEILRAREQLRAESLACATEEERAELLAVASDLAAIRAW